LALGSPNSANGPYDSTCDLAISKGFDVGGRRLRLSFNIFNLFDRRTPLVFDSVTGKAFEPGKGSLIHPTQDPAQYQSYLEAELAKRVSEWTYQFEDQAGRPPEADEVSSYAEEIAPEVSAYVDYQFQRNHNALRNPTYFSQPRTYRMGISYEW
jgi:hypothetical protein